VLGPVQAQVPEHPVPPGQVQPEGHPFPPEVQVEERAWGQGIALAVESRLSGMGKEISRPAPPGTLHAAEGPTGVEPSPYPDPLGLQDHLQSGAPEGLHPRAPEVEPPEGRAEQEKEVRDGTHPEGHPKGEEEDPAA
jgi:hypothetical protein